MRFIAAFALMLTLVVSFTVNAHAETCQYDTAWGVLTLEFNYNTGHMTGNYPHNNGTVSGLLNGSNASGTWYQNNGRGNFAFRFHKRGFRGNWNNAGESGWRGKWDGTLRRCW